MIGVDLDVNLIGSPDSGVEEALKESFENLSFKNTSVPESQEDPKSPESHNKDLPQGRSDAEPDKIISRARETSVSSEDTFPSGAEDNEVSNTGSVSREERVEAVKNMLESYFSDNYLTKDIFLLKHFRRSKEGWISLKFMASYKRIKRTAKCLEEVKEAAQASSLLELHAEGNKIRRLAPMPACLDEYIPTRMTLVGELPSDLRNLTAISKFIAGYGTIASIQLIRPGATLPEVLRETVQKFPKVREQWCALIEFDEMAAMEKLMDAINSGQQLELSWAMELIMPWRTGKHVERSDSIKRRGRYVSCPSSGYSSPCLTPEQSPISTGRRPNSARCLTKRERMMMMQQNALCHTCICQAHGQGSSPSPAASPRKYYCRSGPATSYEGSISPRLPRASKNVNWRSQIQHSP